MASTDLRERAQEYRDATERLVEAKKAFASAFLRHKYSSEKITDRQAEHMAVIDTDGVLDRAYAEHTIAKRVLDAS